MTAVEIRPATPADLPALARLGALLARQHHGYDPRRYFFPEPVEEEYLPFYQAQLARPDAALLVAEVGGRVVGFAFVRLEPAEFLSLIPASGWIHDLFVAESARGAGVGRLLLDRAVLELRRLGAAGVMLSVAPQNEAARRLFLRCGFRFALQEMRLDQDPDSAGGPIRGGETG
jgi:ribosomal protein S18 acetylase RimI-like enzyme